MKPRRFDTFPFNAELELLECRLTELYDAVDAFVLVEARVDHQDHPKPLHYMENRERFAPWKDKIVHVVAQDLPTWVDDSGVWAREHAQREWIGSGLAELDAEPDDIVLQSDVDEIPRALHVRNVNPQGNKSVAFGQRGHFWAIDWEYPPGWCGTVARRFGAIQSEHGFARMRDTRNTADRLPNAGWHMSWLGGKEAALRKVGSFCHPEVRDRIVANYEQYYREGVHVDGIKMRPVDVDKTWPRWMLEPGNVPDVWLRPR